MSRKISSDLICCKTISRRLQSSFFLSWKMKNLSLDTTGIRLRPVFSTSTHGCSSSYGEQTSNENWSRTIFHRMNVINSNKFWIFNRTMCTISKEDRTCWSCKRNIGSEIFFCRSCNIIQPPLSELSLFEMFGSLESFDINAKLLSENYRKLQGMLHPDKFGNSKEEEQQYAAEQSALVNKAYNTVLDPLTRAVYLLELKDIHINEKNTIEDTDFLMEVMETNEALTEVRSKEDLEGIRIKNNALIDECMEGISSSFSKGDYDRAKELVIKLRYYRNILEIIKEKTLQYD